MIHHFNTDIAKECGVNAAVIFDNIAHWIAFNEANGKNLIDGKYWTFNSRKAFQILFPYLSEKQVRTAIDKLRDSGLVETAHHSEDPFDRTLWFALTDKGYLFSDSHDTPNKGENGLAQKGQCMLAQKGQSSHIINKQIINNLEDSLEDNKLSSRSSSLGQTHSDAKKRKFTPPSLEEVEAYIQKEGITNVDPKKFYDHYSDPDKNWKLSNGKRMDNWKLTVRTWGRNNFGTGNPSSNNPLNPSKAETLHAKWGAERDRALEEQGKKKAQEADYSDCPF